MQQRTLSLVGPGRAGTAIATALGCRVRHDLTNIVEGSRKQAHRPSILQDLEAGRPMETETLFEAPLALARQAGVATPAPESAE